MVEKGDAVMKIRTSFYVIEMLILHFYHFFLLLTAIALIHSNCEIFRNIFANNRKIFPASKALSFSKLN